MSGRVLNVLLGRRRMKVFAALLVAAVVAGGAVAYWTTTGTGTASATSGTLSAPTITSATPGAGTVALNWSTVTPPASGAVTYYVTREGGAPSGNCPTSTLPTSATSCTDSGLAAGTYHYTVTAKWRSWTATSTTSTVVLAFGAANATQSALTPTSASITANGTSTQVLTVQAKDANGNNLTAGGSTVTITKQSGTGSIGGVTDNGNGTYTATVTAPTATGSGVFVATLGGSAVKSGTGSQTQATVTYTPGTVTKLVYTTQPSGAAGGTAFTMQPVVTAEDANNNTVTSYAGTVTLAIKSATGTAGAALSGCSGSRTNGVTTFSGCKIDKSGSGYILTATDGTLGVDSTPFTVTVGPAVSLAVSGFTSPTTAGVAHNVIVTAVDAGANTVTGYAGTVHFTSSDPQATAGSGLPANYTFTTGAGNDNGTHTFSATLKTAPTQSITATDTSTSITGSQTGITVNATTATVMAFVNCADAGVSYSSATCAGQPIAMSNNTTLTANVGLFDSFGNPSVPASAVTVSLLSSSQANYAVSPASVLVTPPSSVSAQFSVAKNNTTTTGTITASATGFTSITLQLKKV